MSEIVSKVGIHCVGPSRTGYGDFLKKINNAGRKLALIKCRDDFGAVDEPLLYWPDITTIGAFTQFDRFPFDYAAFEKRALLNPKVKYWEVLNEEDAPSTYKAKTDLYISLAPQFAAHGWGMGLFSCGSGNPPYPEEDGGVSYGEIARACKFMKDNNHPAILCLHEYIKNSGTIGRFKRLADYLEAHDALIPIAITEWGTETYHGDDEFMQMVESLDPLYMIDPRVIGVTAWTLGGGGWSAANWQTAFSRLGDYMATVEPIEIPPDADDYDYWWDLDGVRYDGTKITVAMIQDRVLTPHKTKKVVPPPPPPPPPPAQRYTLTLNPCPEDASLVVNVNPAGLIYDAGTEITCEMVL